MKQRKRENTSNANTDKFCIAPDIIFKINRKNIKKNQKGDIVDGIIKSISIAKITNKE